MSGLNCAGECLEASNLLKCPTWVGQHLMTIGPGVFSMSSYRQKQVDR